MIDICLLLYINLEINVSTNTMIVENCKRNGKSTLEGAHKNFENIF